MISYTKLIEETKRISWLPISKVLNETVKIIMLAVICILFFGSINWILQNGFHNLLEL